MTTKVEVPRDLLLRVLEDADRNRTAAESECAYSEADYVEFAAEKARINELRMFMREACR